MSFSIIMYVEMKSDKPWWLIPFAVAQILILVARHIEEKQDKKIRELERKVDELSKGGRDESRQIYCSWKREA